MTIGPIPTGWKVMQLGEVGRWGSGGTPKRGVAKYFGGDIPWVKSGDLDDGVVTRVEEYITEDGLSSSSAKLVDPGTLLIAMYGATIGKLGIPAVRCATNQAIAFCVPDPSIATTDYLFELLLHMRPELVALGKGGAQPNISQTVLKALEIPVPPLDVQAALVHALRHIRVSSTSTTDHLETAARVIERFRQSVLAAACSGRLTADWLGEHRGGTNAESLVLEAMRRRARVIRKAAAAPAAVKFIDEVPAAWRIVSFDAVTIRITSGSRNWSKFYGRGTGTFVMAQNVRPGVLDWSFRQAVDPPPNDPSRERSQIRKGDLLITIVGANTGDVGPVVEDRPDHFVCQSIALARPAVSASSAYLNLWFNSSQHGQRYFSDCIYGAGRPHLSFDQLRAAPIALPPLEEQHAIVRRTGELMQLADRLTVRVNAAMRRIEICDQAVLAKAFRGEMSLT